MSDDQLSELWRRLWESPRRLLALDYDGTLAPFRVERSAARPLPGVAEALAALRDRGHTALAVISGREAREVAGLLEAPGIPIWGNHGYELLDARGELHREQMSDAQRQGLDSANAGLDPALGPDRVERKHFGVALHTRGLEPSEAAALEQQTLAAWSRLARGHDLRCRPFNGGVELRAAALDKGSALERIMQDLPGRLTVYIGDDATDEDAFKVLAGRGGIGLKVGLDGQSAATGRLANCAAVLDLLRGWVSREARP